MAISSATHSRVQYGTFRRQGYLTRPGVLETGYRSVIGMRWPLQGPLSREAPAGAVDR